MAGEKEIIERLSRIEKLLVALLKHHHVVMPKPKPRKLDPNRKRVDGLKT